MLTLYSQILVNVPFPILMYRKGQGITIVWFELFKLFPVIISRLFFFIFYTFVFSVPTFLYSSFYHFCLYFFFVLGIVNNSSHVDNLHDFNRDGCFASRSSSQSR